MEIKNKTPLVAGMSVQLDKQAAEQLVVAVRGTWSISDRGRLELMKEPPPLRPADVHWGEPATSSVRYEADLGLMKPATDVALVGSAVAPNGRAKRMTVTFRAGSLKRAAVVRGERRWLFGLLGWWFHSPAKPFARVPLQWELAAGGSDTTPKSEQHHSLDLLNPVGRGFRARGSKLRRAGSLLPQIETPGGAKRFGKRPPGGFGFVGGHWLPRRKYAGTYDKAWMEDRCPLLPLDFDERFHNNAAPGLTAKGYFEGGESVEVTGSTRAGKLGFRLPTESPQVTATLDGGPEPIVMRLNTVTVDTDEMRLHMLWRGQLEVHKRFMKLERVDVTMNGGEA
jgi:hypothetical protein